MGQFFWLPVDKLRGVMEKSMVILDALVDASYGGRGALEEARREALRGSRRVGQPLFIGLLAVCIWVFGVGFVLELARRRRSIRRYLPADVGLDRVLYGILVALEAPSGANMQPWRFVVVKDSEVKSRVRRVCEEGEKRFYERVGGELRKWLVERGFSWEKPFLTEAPYLVAVFAELGKPYAVQSVWLAVGYMLLAFEEAGLVSLTYTPPNPGEVGEALGAPPGFALQTIVPVGLAGEDKAKEPRMGLGEAVFVDRWSERLGDG